VAAYKKARGQFDVVTGPNQKTAMASAQQTAQSGWGYYTVDGRRTLPIVIGWWIVNEGADPLPTNANWHPVAVGDLPSTTDGSEFIEGTSFRSASHNHEVNPMVNLANEMRAVYNLAKNTYGGSGQFRIHAGVFGCMQPTYTPAAGFRPTKTEIAASFGNISDSDALDNIAAINNSSAATDSALENAVKNEWNKVHISFKESESFAQNSADFSGGGSYSYRPVRVSLSSTSNEKDALNFDGLTLYNKLKAISELRQPTRESLGKTKAEIIAEVDADDTITNKSAEKDARFAVVKGKYQEEVLSQLKSIFPEVGGSEFISAASNNVSERLNRCKDYFGIDSVKYAWEPFQMNVSCKLFWGGEQLKQNYNAFKALQLNNDLDLPSEASYVSAKRVLMKTLYAAALVQKAQEHIQTRVTASGANNYKAPEPTCFINPTSPNGKEGNKYYIDRLLVSYPMKFERVTAGAMANHYKLAPGPAPIVYPTYEYDGSGGGDGYETCVGGTCESLVFSGSGPASDSVSLKAAQAADDNIINIGSMHPEAGYAILDSWKYYHDGANAFPHGKEGSGTADNTKFNLNAVFCPVWRCGSTTSDENWQKLHAGWREFGIPLNVGNNAHLN